RRDRLVRRVQRHPRHRGRPQDRRRARRPDAQRAARRRAPARPGVPGARHGDADQRRHGRAALLAVLNPSFEDAGLLPGEAEHWTLASVASLEAIAGFGADPELAWEGFERWVALWLALEDVPVVRAFFDT